MPSRLAALALATSLTVTGCTMSASARGTTVAAGIGAMVIGGLVINSGSRDLDGNGRNENVLDDDWGAYMGGSALFLLGTAFLLGGITAQVPDTETATVVGATVPRAPAPVPMVASGDFAALPDRPVAPDGLVLAQRVRAYSAVNQCAAAWETWRSLDAVDADYALVLRRSEAMGSCRPPTP